MSKRGRKIFDDYIASSLAHIDEGFEHPERHVSNLVSEAKSAGVPTSEIEEEVGDLILAIKTARINKHGGA